MAPTFPQFQNGYAHLWDTMTISNDKIPNAAAMAQRILKNKARYQQIERDNGVPWVMAAVIHMRESDLNFNTYLHNGDSLSGYTHHVPSGRPKVGHGPPFTFEESAEDSLKLEGFDTLKGQYTIELMLFCVEKDNGWGYLSKGNSPYVWSWTNQYHGGKYTEDNHYDPNVWDVQPGCAAILYALGELDPDAKQWIERRAGPGGVPSAALKIKTKKERTATQAGAAGATVSTTATTVNKPTTAGGTFAQTMIGGTAIVVFLAIALVGGVMLYRKTQLLKQRWAGSPA